MINKLNVEKALKCLAKKGENPPMLCAECEYFRTNQDDKIPFCDWSAALYDAYILLKAQPNMVGEARK